MSKSQVFRIFFVTLLALSFTTSPLASEEPIRVVTASGQLAGTLTLPDNIDRPIVALIISGSGPTDRNGNGPPGSGRNDSLRMLAVALSKFGVASVRYDKRGVGESFEAGRIESDLRFDDYAQDAATWIRQLKGDPRFSGVAVIGHSEGSLVGMLAVQALEISAFVSLAGAGTRGDETLRRQLDGKLPSDLAKANGDILDRLKDAQLYLDVPTALLALYRASVQPYLISWFRYSPTIEVGKIKAPCLIIQGDSDIQVSVVDATLLHGANKKCSLEVISGMNHIFKKVPIDMVKQIESYSDPTLQISVGLSEVLQKFFRPIQGTTNQ